MHELSDIKKALAEAGYYDKKQSKKPFKFPFSWNSNAKKAGKKSTEESQLCLYLTKSGYLKGPMWLPIIAGNIIIYKNKGHEFIPSEVLRMKIGNKDVSIYIIREIDRKPVSNSNWNEVVKRGDSTRNDEVLLKMLKLAMIEKVKSQVNKSILWIIGVVLALGIVAYVVFA